MTSVFISSGEASGDLLGANLVAALYEQNPDLTLFGMGGKKMQAAGVDIILDSDAISVVGFWEVITHFSAIRRAMNTVTDFLKNNRPDLIILIDFPGFNLRLAKIAKDLGIKVLFYVSPQVWAWRYGRVKKIRERVDHMAVLFEFEKTIYDKENIPATFVGHPLVDVCQPTLTPEQAYQQFQLDPHKPIIALFPGSRHGEIKRLLPTIVKTAARIKHTLPNAQFVLPLADTVDKAAIKAQTGTDITVIDGQVYDLLPLCDAAIAVSGTVTLEIALNQVPFTIIYKTSWITALIVRFILHIPVIGLCNIVAEKMIIKELLQHNARPKVIAGEILRLIQDTAYRDTIKRNLACVRDKIGKGNGAHKTASIAMELLKRAND